MQSANERRRSPRHRFDQQLLFQTRERGAPSVAKVRDASATGLYIETDRRPHCGRVIAGVLRLDPLGRVRPVCFLAEVVRSDRWRDDERTGVRRGFAVRFIRISRTGRDRLEDALTGDLPLPATPRFAAAAGSGRRAVG